MSKTKSETSPLTADEMSAIEILCDLAHKPTNKQQQLTDGTKENAEGPPLRLQNLGAPTRAKACRVVLAYVNGINYQDALAAQGLTHLEFTAIRLKDHNFGLMYEAAKRLKTALMAENAQIGLDRLITEDGCGLNAKAVMFAAERLDRQTFSKPTDEADGGRGGAKTIYNITINANSGVQPCGNLAATPIEAEVIDENAHK
jgi:hypothetical protein